MDDVSSRLYARIESICDLMRRHLDQRRAWSLLCGERWTSPGQSELATPGDDPGYLWFLQDWLEVTADLLIFVGKVVDERAIDALKYLAVAQSREDFIVGDDDFDDARHVEDLRSSGDGGRCQRARA